MIIDMDNRSLKYKILLSAFRVLPVKKLMAGSTEKTQKLFRKAYKGADIPTLRDPALMILQKEVAGSKVLYARHKKKADRAGIYLVGGGMLKYPKPGQAKEIVKLARECDMDMLLPYYPVLFTGATLPDAYQMVYELYRETLKEYAPENICLMGGSSGGNLALGLVSYINARGEGLPKPGRIYAGSPGTLLLTDGEKQMAEKQEKTDVIMSLPALENIWEGMTGGKEVPNYMKYLQVGDYTGLKDVYLSFGGDELFLAGAESIRKRLEEYGVHVTVEIGKGLYHSYAMLPLVKEAEEGYRNFVRYISGK